MVTFRCPSSTTTIAGTPDVSTPLPTYPANKRNPRSSSTTTTTTTTSRPTEDATPAPRQVAKGLSLNQFRANLLEYLKAMKTSGKRAITWHEEDEPGPLFDIESPDPKYPGGRLYLTRAFYDGYRQLLTPSNPWPSVQEILDEFGVTRDEMMGR